MNAKLLFKIRQTGRNYKNKPTITYLLIAANFFVLFSLYYCIFCCCLSIDPSVGRNRYRGTKNDITGQKTISRDISFLCHRVIALIKAQVCDKASYHISNLDLLHTEFEGEHPINTADPLVNNAQTALQDNPHKCKFC